MKYKAVSAGRILPVVIILFICQIMLLPFVTGLTYATRSERPEHILTYKNNSLSWDGNTRVRSDGSAVLSFFETLYSNVNAENAQKVLAPGTEKDSIIRLKNNSGGEVRYTAVLYSLTESKELCINAGLSGSGFGKALDYTLPDNVGRESVISAVSGFVEAGKMQDFDINWFWSFEEAGNEAKDGIDTYLGNKSASGKADEATIGFYLVVDDGNHVIPPTGDRSMLGYAVLALVCGAAVLVLVIIKAGKSRNEG